MGLNYLLNVKERETNLPGLPRTEGKTELREIVDRMRNPKRQLIGISKHQESGERRWQNR